MGVFDKIQPDNAMKWYGIIAIFNAASSLIVYLIWANRSKQIASWQVGVWMKQFLWWPVAISWLYTYIKDYSKLNRVILENSVSLSILDPFAGAWIGLNMALIHAHWEERASSITTWISLGVWSGITIFEMCLQA